MEYRGLTLYPFQADAIRAIEEGRSVVVSAPTGAGKTIIAEYAIEKAIAKGRRVLYTSPVKALSNQKYRDFVESYGEDVGITTGDVTINPGAQIQVMTTEIFRNTIFEDQSRLEGIDFVVFDEAHYLGDDDRGSVWEESIIFAPSEIRFVALSATISNLQEFRDWIAMVREEDVALIKTDERPVPLKHYFYLSEDGIFETRDLKENLRRAKSMTPPRRDDRGGRSSRGRDDRGGRGRDSRGGGQGRGRGRDRNPPRRNNLLPTLVKEGRIPILYFCFSRRRCEQLAVRLQRKLRLFEKDERRRVLAMYDELIERYEIGDHPAVPTLRESVGKGVLYHHAGMLPVFKDVVERLFTSGLVKLLFTTETFALGVNMPARSVVFDSMSKFNGVDIEPISPLQFRQMAGRAGRQGLDEEGDVYCILDPERDSAKIIAEIVHKKPGAIRSRFNLGYATILNLYRLIGRDIAPAVEKSFAAFPASLAEGPARAPQGPHARPPGLPLPRQGGTDGQGTILREDRGIRGPPCRALLGGLPRGPRRDRARDLRLRRGLLAAQVGRAQSLRGDPRPRGGPEARQETPARLPQERDQERRPRADETTRLRVFQHARLVDARRGLRPRGSKKRHAGRRPRPDLAPDHPGPATARLGASFGSSRGCHRPRGDRGHQPRRRRRRGSAPTGLILSAF